MCKRLFPSWRVLAIGERSTKHYGKAFHPLLNPGARLAAHSRVAKESRPL
jgi:hypothetical protein